MPLSETTPPVLKKHFNKKFESSGNLSVFLDVFEEEENDWSAVEAEVEKSGCALVNLDMVVIPSSEF